MGLFLPTSEGVASQPFAERVFEKGRLTNLDVRPTQWISFQFNPVVLEFEAESKWADIAWRGAELGGDLAYLGSGPDEFELVLRFVSEPAAPDMEAETEIAIPHPDYRVDFEALEATINKWRAPIPALGRPARINVAFGRARWFNAVIVRRRIRIEEFHDDLTARQALLTLEMRQWEWPTSLQQ
jgi:hypothetical protein